MVADIRDIEPAGKQGFIGGFIAERDGQIVEQRHLRGEGVGAAEQGEVKGAGPGGKTVERHITGEGDSTGLGRATDRERVVSGTVSYVIGHDCATAGGKRSVAGERDVTKGHVLVRRRDVTTDIHRRRRGRRDLTGEAHGVARSTERQRAIIRKRGRDRRIRELR